MITSSGVYHAGRVSRFAIVDGSSPIPSGVLCLAELDDNDIGRGVFDAVARGQLWGFSFGGNGRAEISLTGDPAYTNCRVVGWGADALSLGSCLPGLRRIFRPPVRPNSRIWSRGSTGSSMTFASCKSQPAESRHHEAHLQP